MKHPLKLFKEELCREFSGKADITQLTRKLIHYIDGLLLSLFQKHELSTHNRFCLLALGSYGRRELQLYSDVDLLLLHQEEVCESELQQAQAFIQDCWDLGLEISHQITTVQACADLASHDLSVISSIMDRHLLCGNGKLLEELDYHTHPLHMWPSKEYFLAKYQEQKQRYKKYGDTAYNLEPNVKQGPGGLRDLQILLSISKRHFGLKKLAEGINERVITEKEYEEWGQCQHFLWRVRFALHMIAGKQEERLLFDHQVALASLFGFSNNSESLAIEQFMKSYFKVIKRIRELNEILLQWFSETILTAQKREITFLDHHFQLLGDFIGVRHTKVFSQNPESLVKLFVWLAKYPSIAGVSAATIRLIHAHLYLIGKHFRTNPCITQQFLTIFQEVNPFKALRHMNRYGVLSRYLECFGAITGQMQYDLYHVYTVDQHTLFVIRNLVRFLNPNFTEEFPLAAELMAHCAKKEILYLAALFHDIAKGRGGDHSELGAEEAANFARTHQLSPADSQLLIWLVRNHLLMSQTAQRQNIYDPKTIQRFCDLLPETDYLDYLYLLTVADICATNRRLWNSWKDSLLKELFHAAHKAQQQQIIMNEALSELKKQQAWDLLKPTHSQKAVETLWQHFKHRYFLQESPEMIACHTDAILNCQHYPLVLVLEHPGKGGTEVFIYMPHRDERFSIATTVLSNQQATIQEATIITCDNQFDLDTYIILNEHHQAFFTPEQSKAIQTSLINELSKPILPTLSKRRLSRRQNHFKIPPKISFDEEYESPFTRLFLVTADRPGLLAEISRIFSNRHIHLHNAKISTAGERVEDMFYISGQTGLPLSLEEKEALKEQLTKKLG